MSCPDLAASDAFSPPKSELDGSDAFGAPEEPVLVLTDEQTAVVKDHPAKTEIIQVCALAGTGKTSTLREFCELCLRNSPDTKILYICFNKAVREQAAATFPSNTTAATIDSLACKGYKVSELTTEWPEYSIFSHFAPAKKVEKGKEESAFDNAPAPLPIPTFDIRLLTGTIQAFCNSSSDEPNEEHAMTGKVDPPEYERYVEMATAIFFEMVEKRMPCMIQVARKMFQLTGKTFEKMCDILLIDEAQDLNPTMYGIVQNNVGKVGIVYVGDPRQRIYTFLGSIDLFKMLEPTRRYALTHCHRFGSNICDYVNRVMYVRTQKRLDRARGTNSPFAPKTLKDCDVAYHEQLSFTVSPDVKDIVVESVLDIEFDEEKFAELEKKIPMGERDLDHFVYLFRTNGAMLDIIEQYLFDPRRLDTPIYIVGYASLARRTEYFHRMLVNEPRKFSREYVTALKMNNSSQTKIMSFVKKERAGYGIVKVLSNMKNRQSGSMASAAVIFSTVHSYKGQEAHTVILGRDIVIPGKVDDDESWNLLYVALTRAKCMLQPSSALMAYVPLKEPYTRIPDVFERYEVKDRGERLRAKIVKKRRITDADLKDETPEQKNRRLRAMWPSFNKK